jgi:D-alanine-D-alanine ligase
MTGPLQQLRVLILYNEPVLPVGHPDFESEHDILNTVEAVARALTEAAFDVSRLGVSRDARVLLESLNALKPDVVFNLFEGTADHGHTESYVAGLLEWCGVPFTGSPAQALALARNKPLTKYLLQGADVPTAPFVVVDQLPVPPCPLKWPVIVKPAQEDGSVGLDQGSVVSDQRRLEERVARLLQLYGQAVIIEEFIAGREINVAIIETPRQLNLAISEVLFVDNTPGYWPIVTYDAKWKAGSREFESTPPRCPAEVSPELAQRLHALAQRAFRLLGCRDYARVDFRAEPSGPVYLLEVNPNSDLCPSAGLAGALNSLGMTYHELIVKLAQNALTRGSGTRWAHDKPGAKTRCSATRENA